MNPSYDSGFWNQRYGQTDYVFGTAPNDFLAAVAPALPPGPVLCLAEGEGRNAVFLAARGHAVTAVDQSAVGLAKASALAAARGVPLATVCADLAAYPISPDTWAAVVVIFLHLPPPLRRTVLGRAAAGLRPGGALVIEVYTPAQLGRGTGGPRDLSLLVTLADLRAELPDLVFEIGRELERSVVEGTGHTGPAAVVQVLARRPPA